MAHAPISGGDLTTLRSNQSVLDLSLFVTPLQSVVTGTITAVPAKYPTVSLTVSWDGSTSATSVGQLVRITNGTTIRTYSVVRKAISGSTLYLSETPLGAFGYATMIENPILVGDTVTIYTHRPLWGMYSRIDPKTKTFYKQWDVPYTSQNEGIIPIANAGVWQAAKLASGEITTRFTLPRGGVQSSFVLGSSSPTYLWALPTGVSLVSGYALSDSIIEVDAEAGSYLVSLTVTKSGNNHTAYLWLFVSDGTNHLSATNVISLPQSDSQSRLGREMAFRVYGDNLQDLIYPGAGFLLREWPHYDSGTLTEGVGVDSFIGYITDIEFSHDGNIGSASFKVESPMIYANRIAQPPQSLEEVTEAANWVQCESVLSNPCGFAYYLIRWHTPTLLEMHDFNAEDYTTPRRKYLQCNNSRSLGSNLAVVAGYLAGNMGSASDGTTVLRPNPLYMTQTNRDLVDTILEFQEQDIAAPLNYARRMVNAYAEVRGGAFAFSGTGKEKAWCVGRRWSQGSNSTDMPNFTVTVAEGLNEAKSKIGHFFAEQNAEIEEIGLDLTLNIDVLDPAYMAWSAFSVASQYDPYGNGFVSNRILPSVIEREWSLDKGSIIKSIKVRSQGETFGQAGEELPMGANANQNGFSNGTPVLFQPHISSGLFSGEKSPPIFLAHNIDGDFASLLNYMTANPQWTDLRNPLNNEAVNDWCLDYGSVYFASGGDASQALGVYAVTTDGATANIWYFADVLRSNLAENIKTLTLADSTITSEARIACSESYPLLVLAGFKDGTGTRYSRSTDGGASFSSLTHVGATISDNSANDNAPLGLAVDGQRQLISAPAALDDWQIYYASTASGSFSALSSSPSGISPQPMIQIAPDSTTAYATKLIAGSQLLTFDPTVDSIPNTPNLSPIYPGWSHDGDVTMWGLNSSLGNGGGYCFRGNGTDVGLSTDLTIYMVESPNTRSITNITFDYYISSGSPSVTFKAGASFASSFVATRDDAWHSVDWDADIGATSWSAASALNFLQIVRASNSSADIRIDNLEIITSVPFVSGTSGTLYKVTSFTTSPSWSDISPSAGEAPEYPYDLAVDRVDSNILNFVSGVGTDWYVSTNGGTNFSTFASNTPYRALYTQGNHIAAGGLLSVALSFNNGTDFIDESGNLDSLWGGSIGRIKHVLTL